jgi:hypothetical protein
MNHENLKRLMRWLDLNRLPPRTSIYMWKPGAWGISIPDVDLVGGGWIKSLMGRGIDPDAAAADLLAKMDAGVQAGDDIKCRQLLLPARLLMAPRYLKLD